MNYYNDFDPFCCQWLRNLIDAGLIPPGDVDSRSIKEVSADDVRGYTQCHFFAGIGGWAEALRLAGVSPDEPLWTASCPCQPWSVSGAGKGEKDERHLWPECYRLIRECRPSIAIGEQVERAIGLGWLDSVCDDLEAEGYACGAAVLPACSIGAMHERKRLWWVADSNGSRWQGCQSNICASSSQATTPTKRSYAIARDRNRLVEDIGGVLLSDGISVGLERCRIHGYGNAIVPQVAAEFIAAYFDIAGQ